MYSYEQKDYPPKFKKFNGKNFRCYYGVTGTEIKNVIGIVKMENKKYDESTKSYRDRHSKQAYRVVKYKGKKFPYLGDL